VAAMISLLYLLIYVLFIVLVGAVLLWAIDQLGVQEPMRKISRVIVVLICLLIVLVVLLDGVGYVRVLPLR
jgi:hypothetical protein